MTSIRIINTVISEEKMRKWITKVTACVMHDIKVSFMKHKTYFVLLLLVTLGENASPDFDALLGGTDTS